MNFLLKTASIFSILLIILLVYLNVALYSGPELRRTDETRNDVLRQLNFLEDELKNKDLGRRMQGFFPEGFVFVNALYGLSWAEIARGEKAGTPLHERAISEARYAYAQVNSQYAKNGFQANLTPEYGIFYCGWKNYLLAKILSAQNEKDSSEREEFRSNCRTIAASLSGRTPFPESYANSSWPADAFVAAASLSLHDEMFEAGHELLLKSWLRQVKARLDPNTGLLPHSTEAFTGNVSEGARGSSICLMLIFLAEIDPVFAQHQFSLFSEKFSMTRMGLPAIREYPHGVEGEGDVDSGPVILDIGFAGTIVSVGTFKKFGQYEIADRISANIESFGFTYGNSSEKKFIFGLLPMADAFIAWTRIMEAAPFAAENNELKSRIFGSTILFHFYSFIIIMALLTFLLRKKIFRIKTGVFREGLK